MAGDRPKEAGSEITAYYNRGKEADRLLKGAGLLEFARTQELIMRYLSPPPAVVMDIGAGAGIYSCWLASLGYEVHLVDAVPLHIEQARQASLAQSEHPIASLAVGDARRIQRPDDSVGAVLLLGPLYHLTEREDRVAALGEARRILCQGGFCFAAGISRFASVLDGLKTDLLDEPDFVRIVKQDLADGQHRNPTRHPGYFAASYFHLPEELGAEMREAGLAHERTFPIQGPACMLQDVEERWQDDVKREAILRAVRWLESEPSLIGASSHLLAVGRKAE